MVKASCAVCVCMISTKKLNTTKIRVPVETREWPQETFSAHTDIICHLIVLDIMVGDMEIASQTISRSELNLEVFYLIEI